MFTKNLQKVPRYDHDIYTKYLSMYIPAIDHCYSALTDYIEWVEDDDNLVRKFGSNKTCIAFIVSKWPMGTQLFCAMLNSVGQLLSFFFVVVLNFRKTKKKKG